MFGTSSSPALWSALRPDTNPLIRPSDRRQARIAAVVVALALIAAPLMAAYGFTYHASLTDRAAAQQHEHYQVDAELLEEAPATQSGGAVAFQMPRHTTALAEWTSRDGQRHESVIPVAGGTSAGETVTIWVDRDGNRTTAPLSPNQTATAATMTTFGLWLVFVAVLASVYVAMRVRLDRERYAAWDREWRELDEHRT